MILWVAIGGFFGAISRFWISQLCKKIIKSSFPYATFLVNILGSFGLGFIIGVDIHKSMLALIGVGFFGAFTTFSTFKLETIQLRKKKRIMISYLMLSYAIGLIAAFVGLILGRQF